MEIEVFENEPGRWAYRIGAHFQPFDPEHPGHVAMTEARARALAEAEAARMAEIETT